MSEQVLDAASPDESFEYFSMSWTAYVKPTMIVLFALVVGALLYAHYRGIAIVIWLAFLALTVYRYLWIRSVKLYTNDEGVWVYSGILPWSKGTAGVKWRDIDEAVFFTGFWSWLLRSYTVRIGHRFTKTSEIVLHHIAHGRDVVERINEKHVRMLGDIRDRS
jgi:hypothetical protein